MPLQGFQFAASRNQSTHYLSPPRFDRTVDAASSPRHAALRTFDSACGNSRTDRARPPPVAQRLGGAAPADIEKSAPNRSLPGQVDKTPARGSGARGVVTKARRERTAACDAPVAGVPRAGPSRGRLLRRRSCAQRSEAKSRRTDPHRTHFGPPDHRRHPRMDSPQRKRGLYAINAWKRTISPQSAFSTVRAKELPHRAVATERRMVSAEMGGRMIQV